MAKTKQPTERMTVKEARKRCKALGWRFFAPSDYRGFHPEERRWMGSASTRGRALDDFRNPSILVQVQGARRMEVTASIVRAVEAIAAREKVR